MKISDIYLFSDVDGTLYSAATDVLPANKEAVKRFISKGGNFALATGRSVSKAQEIAHSLNVNIPCILNNGASIYDFSQEKYIHTAFLPEAATQYCEHILAKFPEITPTAICDDKAYRLSLDEDGRLISISDDAQTPFNRNREKNIFRFIFLVDPDICATINEYIMSCNFENVDFCSSDRCFIDIVPQNVSKGAALKVFCEKYGVDLNNTASIGDYYNDLQMLKTSTYSACVSTAPDDLKAVCKISDTSFNDGAVAKFIEYIESICEEG